MFSQIWCKLSVSIISKICSGPVERNREVLLKNSMSSVAGSKIELKRHGLWTQIDPDANPSGSILDISTIPHKTILIRQSPLLSTGPLHLCSLPRTLLPHYPQAHSFALLSLISEVFHDNSLTLTWFIFSVALTPSDTLAVPVLHLSSGTSILVPWGLTWFCSLLYPQSLRLCLEQSRHIINT